MAARQGKRNIKWATYPTPYRAATKETERGHSYGHQ